MSPGCLGVFSFPQVWLEKEPLPDLRSYPSTVLLKQWAPASQTLPSVYRPHFWTCWLHAELPGGTVSLFHWVVASPELKGQV